MSRRPHDAPPRSRLEEIRRLRFLTSAELARRADMDPTTVWRIESGGRSLTINWCDGLARALEVPVATLYAPIGTPVPPPASDPVVFEPRPYDPAHAAPRVARRLLAVQRLSGLTELELAMAIEATEPEVVDWLEGRFLPPVPLMNRLAKLAGFTLHWLYHGDEAGMARGIAARLRTLLRE
jgi:transcriptional regulator with XRE-family HTH domain